MPIQGLTLERVDDTIETEKEREMRKNSEKDDKAIGPQYSSENFVAHFFLQSDRPPYDWKAKMAPVLEVFPNSTYKITANDFLCCTYPVRHEDMDPAQAKSNSRKVPHVYKRTKDSYEDTQEIGSFLDLPHDDPTKNELQKSVLAMKFYIKGGCYRMTFSIESTPTFQGLRLPLQVFTIMEGTGETFLRYKEPDLRESFLHQMLTSSEWNQKLSKNKSSKDGPRYIRISWGPTGAQGNLRENQDPWKEFKEIPEEVTNELHQEAQALLQRNKPPPEGWKTWFFKLRCIGKCAQKQNLDQWWQQCCSAQQIHAIEKSQQQTSK